MARIQLKNVTKGWGSVVGVDNVDLEIHDEEFMVFLGPSGCGKTTTMRMIAGLNDLTSGEIWIDDEMVNDLEPRDRDVAMVFQSYALYPNMSVYDNIRFPLRMRGIPANEHDARVRKAAEMVDLGAYLHRKPGALSGGQRQRAALARAIVRQPRVFLMDEPLSNLDAKLRTTMRVQLKHVQRQLKITTVYVTHDQVEAMTLADRIVIMDKGRIQQLGTPDEIYSNPANTFVAGFIGSPPMNLIKGDISGGSFRAPGVKVSDPALQDTKQVVLGVRPEDAFVCDENSAQMKGMIYGIEPTGDQTFLTIRTDAFTFDVKADRDFRQALDTPIFIRFDPTRLYLFDAVSGQRINAK